MVNKHFGLWEVDAQGNIHYNGKWDYSIHHTRLGEPDWEEHMSAKWWVNINDFMAALEHAKTRVHKYEKRNYFSF